MIRKLFVALSAAVFITAVAITILGHCGSTWVVQPPTFGPQLTNSNCLAGPNPTTTSKSVSTTIHWTVGPPLTVVVTDTGENKLLGELNLFGIVDAQIAVVEGELLGNSSVVS